MNWVFIIWGCAAGAALTLAVLHFAVWMKSRQVYANLAFSIAAFAMVFIALFELAMMGSATPASFGQMMQWIYVPLTVFHIGLCAFVYFYLGNTMLWLAILSVILRFVCLIVNFAAEPNLFYSQISSLQETEFLGQIIFIVKEAKVSRWSLVNDLSGGLVLWFVIDASLRLWKQGAPEERRRAAMIGGSMAIFIILAVGIAILIRYGIRESPYLISLPFLAIVIAMGSELIRDVLRASQLNQEMAEISDSMQMAAVAARVTFWRWDIEKDIIWFNFRGGAHYGVQDATEIKLQSFLQILHPDDREATRAAIKRAMDGDGIYQASYRVCLPVGSTHWIDARGRVDFAKNGKPLCLRGISADNSLSHDFQAQVQLLQDELAHVSRAATLSELSTSLAHELNQPLAANLTNAQAGQILLTKDHPDLDALKEIFADIVVGARQAGEVTKRLRTLLKREKVTPLPIGINDAILDVLHLLKGYLVKHHVTLSPALEVGLPSVLADRIQIQQILLNLIFNAVEAMEEQLPANRRIEVQSHLHGDRVRVSIRDTGCGLPEDRDSLFAPFRTTKPDGLGMGLAICRTILEAHSGKLWADPHPEQGAVFTFELPVSGMNSGHPDTASS